MGGAAAEKAAEITIVGVDTAIKANALVSGTGLNVGGTSSNACNFIAAKSGVAASLLEVSTGQQSKLGASNFDCFPLNKFGPLTVVDSPIYRRTDNAGVYSAEQFTVATGGTVAQNEPVFVNGRGPMKVGTALTAAGAALEITDVAN